MKAVVFSLGCKVNQYESYSLALTLKQLGYDVTTQLCPAQLYVINTCSVTVEADKKSRQAISRVLKLNQNASVVVLGCSSQNNPQPYLSKPNVIAVAGNGSKTQELYNILTNPTHKTSFDLPKAYHTDTAPEQDKTRALIKIQDGCNRFCSYCIVPHLRGRSRSKPMQDIVNEAIQHSHSTQEIVLTGIDISSYTNNTGEGLSSLITALKPVKTRKRLGSLECSVINHQLLQAMSQSNFCNHFHLSLQSGSDTVLKRMNRKYTTQQYLSKVNLIREYFPLAGITTDIITGFCGETQQEHLQTLEFIAKVQFSDIHVFPFSPRLGTKAYSMPTVDNQTKTQRANQLNELKNQLKQSFLQKNLNQIAQVYVEQSQKDYNFGFTTNYIKVYTKQNVLSLSNHKLNQLYQDGILGTKTD